MKTIEVKTTQNVVLEYELADLRDRAIAFVIDQVVIWLTVSILLFIGFGGFGFEETAAMVFFIFLTCIFIFYSLVFEILNNGQSIGKMAMKIQVIKTAGGQATMSDYTARWVFRMLDIWFSAGGVASILVASSAKAQRVGDIVATTAVIKLIPSMNLRLNDLLAIRSQESYKPTYILAKQLDEVDVLLIKTTLERYRKFKNSAHEEAVEMLAGKTRSALNITSSGPNDIHFLQTVLNDYVVLTR